MQEQSLCLLRFYISDSQHNIEDQVTMANPPTMDENHLYQYSLLNALMSGVCESGVPVHKYKKTGNQGFGTFTRMDGELIFLDDKVYQLRAHGNVTEAGPDAQIPFGLSTTFVSQNTVTTTLTTKDDIEKELNKFNDHATNLYMSYRIQGRFSYIKYRTVCGQEYKGQPLSELADKQFVDECKDIEVTIVGLRTPENWQGFGVAGEHLHFIDKDRKVGGHILELKGEDVEMQMAVVSHVHVELPTSDDFNAAHLTVDDAGIKKAEG